MTEPTRALLFCAASLLDQGRTIDRLSRPLTAAALIGILAYPIIGLPSWVPVAIAIPVALAGLAEACFAARVGFDAALFHRLASSADAPDFAGTDAALAQLGLLSAAKLGRPAETRVAGAKRLVGFQILAVVAQVLSVLAGACIALSWH